MRFGFLVFRDLRMNAMSVPSDGTNVPSPLIARVEREEHPEVTVSAPAVEGTVTPWDVATKRTAFIILLIIGAGVLWLSRPVIPLLLVAGIGAYLLSPIVDGAQRLRIPRSVTTIVLYVLVLVGLVLLPVVLVPVLLQQVQVITDFDVNSTAVSLINWVMNSINSIPPTFEILGFTVSIGESLQNYQQNLGQLLTVPTLADLLGSVQQLISTATTVVGSTASLGLSVVGRVVQIFVLSILTFFLSLYLTKDAPQITEYVKGLFPRSFQPELAELLRRIGFIWQSFFRGQILLCLTIGLITWGALQLVGMPGALILGIVAGAMEIIPNLGPTLATIPAVIVALLQGSDVLEVYGIGNFQFALLTIAVYFIIQQLENAIIVPRVIGSSVNLHPIVIICGVVIGFNVFGIWGAFFAAPVIASLRVIGGYVHAKLLDYPPFQEQQWKTRPRRPLVYRRTVTGDQLHGSTSSPRGATSGASLNHASRSGVDTPLPERASEQPHSETVADVRNEQP
jgi:predicted PurR-regulated permease PerM